MDAGDERLPLRRFTRREYDDLIDRGFFEEDEHIELLRGLLVTMSPHGHEHYSITCLVGNVLTRALPPRFGVAMHSPFCATEDSEPEPDVCVFDCERFPRTKPTEALLLVEVSGDSLRRDRDVKLSIYAENGVPEYWIVILATQEVEVYTDPRDGGYVKMERIGLDGVLRPAFDPTIEIPLRTLPWPDAS
jgi:Uma2 family endonuclease